MAESPVNINTRNGEVQGQAQARQPEPHDGVHKVFETVAVTDRVITDANSDLAVQVPEGVGASTYGHYSPLGEALAAGTPEEQFASGDTTENTETDTPVATEQNEDQTSDEEQS
jgi:hypothetical protein